MSRSSAHPLRERKIIKWISGKSPGHEFGAREIAKDLDLMPVEVGNILKYQGNIKIVRYEYRQGAVWQVLA
jgi:hypothetical protein